MKMNWLTYALMTVAAWGVYGVFLKFGNENMHDKQNGGLKAFLLVGVAYFLIAVLAPLAILVARGASWNMPVAGMSWSLVAGIVGAIGAFCVILAYREGGLPPVVMSIVFAGAPIVNAIVATAAQPPQGGLATVKPQFIMGLLCAALGGFLVTKYRPADPPKKGAPAQHAPATAPATK